MKKEEFDEIIHNFYIASEHLSIVLQKISEIEGEISYVEADRFTFFNNIARGKVENIYEIINEKGEEMKWLKLIQLYHDEFKKLVRFVEDVIDNG